MILYILKYKIYSGDDYYYDCYGSKDKAIEFYYNLVDFIDKPYEFYILTFKLCDCKDITSFAFIGGKFKL